MQYFRKQPFGQKVTDAFSSVASNRTISILSLLIIIATLPVTLFLSKNQAQYYGHAATSGTLYYVDNSSTGCNSGPCSDSNNGTSPATAWKTISQVQSTLSTLQPGDQVLFKRGDIWYEELDLTNIHGTSGNPITFGNYGSGAMPVIDGGSKRANCIYASTINPDVSYVTINGFECRNTTQHGIYFGTQNGNMPGIVVENSYIHNTGPGACAGCGTPYDDGTYANQLDFEDWTQGADGVQFLNNTINNCGGHNCVNVHYDTGSPVVRGNTVGPGCVHNCIDLKGVVGGVVDQNMATSGGGSSQNAFYTENTKTSHEDITYTRNVAYNSPHAFHIENGGSCTNAPCSITAKYYNNTVYVSSGQYNFMDTTCANTSMDIRNNIIDGGGIDIHGPPNCAVTWDYNDDGASQHFSSVNLNGSSTMPVGSHDLYNINPLYVNASANNFHLTAGSPVIGKALSTLDSGMTDLGAYEYSSTTPPPASQSTWRVDTGSTSSYTDTQGNIWSADTRFAGGSIVNRGTILIANTSDPAIFQTEHYGMSSVSYAVPNGTYTVNLDFAETYSGITGPGQRVFNVAINGTQVLTNFDVYAQAGGSDIALVKRFPVSVTMGQITITFTPVVQLPEVNGIQILPSTPTSTPTPTPTQISTNLIQNGSFENTGTNGLAPWVFQVQSGAAATITQVSNTEVDGTYSARVNITQTNSTEWYVQLKQSNIPLTANRTYTLSFWAKASTNQSTVVDIGQAYGSYTTYFYRLPNLTTSWEQYSYTFTPSVSDTNVQLAFNLAQNTGYVWIDAVSLQ